ncbi:MAG: acyltransferase [Nocardia sp.]|uniref:acyltransferase n=1 Tax=Nocardia sp. TaxID=1821 RepID=UPI00260C223D|nr:acyltransferase [Nocardia sp.]MCU1640704.1 acyltransferase [Nocardia sp.]
MSTDAAIRVPEAGRRRARPYLHQIDLFRILTFACVIGVHVVGQANDPGNVSANGVMTLLHFTRYAFFALTGFVLVYQFANDSFRAKNFWPRRFALVGIPYVAWSVVYWAYSIHLGQNYGTPGWLLSRLGLDLLFGTAYYHLYFLLVTMQVYLLFPLLLKLLRRTEGRHRWVLMVSAALELLCLWSLTYPPFTTGFPGQLWLHLYATVVPYQFFTVLGAIAAWHIETVHAFLRRHARVIAIAVVLAAIAAEWDYQRLVQGGLPPWMASGEFMPERIVWFIGVTVGLYLLGTQWAAQRQDHDLLARAVRYGADRSFGIFLIHPLILEILMPIFVSFGSTIGRFWETVLLYFAVVALSLAGTEVLRRIPGSLWLTGRPMLRTDLSVLVPRRFRMPAPTRDSSKEVVCSPTP